MILAAGLLVVWAARADVSWHERHVAPQYCVSEGSTPWLFQALRIGAVVLAVLLVAVVRQRVARLGQIARLERPEQPRLVARRELAITAGGVTLALVASLGVTELVLRRMKWDDRIPTSRRDMPEAHADPRLGWVFRPLQTRRVVSSGRTIEYAINARGERAARQDDLRDFAAPTLVVAGESIAFGEGLAWEETLGALVGRALGLQVANIAVPAYGNDQVHLRLLEALPRLRPARVIITFVPQQIRRNGLLRRAHFVLGPGGELRLAPPATGLRSWRLWRLFTDEPYHGGSTLAVTHAILRETTALVRARGAEPLFVVTNYGPPCQARRGGEPWIIDELFTKRHLPYVRVDLAGQDVISAVNPHPNPRGARKLADAITQARP